MNTILRILKFSAQDIARNVWLSVATITILVLTLFSINIMATVRVISDNAIEVIKGKVDFSVYLKSEAGEGEILALKTKIEGLNNVKSVDYVSKQQALQKFRDKNQNNQQVIEALRELGKNPLSPSLNILPNDTTQAAQLVESLKRLDSDIIESRDFSDNAAIVNQEKKSSLEVAAHSAFAIWEKSGKVVYEKNKNEKLPIASLTKIVAARVFLDTKISLDKVVVYKKADEDFNYQYCSPWESAKLTVKDGETMTVRDLLYSALVGSANNAVESLVRVSGLKREEFIAKMNSTVKKWGAKNTNFVEPTGLSPENMSSVSDYAIISKEALKDLNLQKIDTAKTYSFKTINTKKVHNLKNTSKLLQDKNYQITASKTGYLEEAGHCLMSRVKVGNDNLIVVILGGKSSTSSLEETKKIIDYSVAK